jgi:hypothetical protein
MAVKNRRHGFTNNPRGTLARHSTPVSVITMLSVISDRPGNRRSLPPARRALIEITAGH